MSTIIKGQYDHPFVTLYNEAVQDPDLSMAAKGLHAYLLSMPTNWKIHVRELPNHFSNGRDAIAKALNELIEKTYVIREEVRESGKFKGYEYQVFPLKYQRAIELGIIKEIPQKKTENDENPKEKADKPKEEIPYKEIVSYLNERTGKQYRHTTAATRKAISGRWNDGYRLEHFKHVIDVKADEWKGTDMEKYLCPDTLFRPSNFEKYLNQKRRTKPNKVNYPKFEYNAEKKFNPDEIEAERQRLLREAGII